MVATLLVKKYENSNDDPLQISKQNWGHPHYGVRIWHKEMTD